MLFAVLSSVLGKRTSSDVINDECGESADADEW